MHKRVPILRWILYQVVIISGLGLVLSYCSFYINPLRFLLPAFFGLYFVPLVVVNAFLLLLLFIRRSSLAWIPFLSLLPTLLFVELFVQWGSTNKEIHRATIKIASYNVCNFQGYDNKSRDETVSEINRFLEREEVDIVCMQEFYCPDTSQIGKLFPSFPFRHMSHKGRGKSFRGNLILSRFNTAQSGEIFFQDNHRNCIYADFQIYGMFLRVYTTHFESNKISLNALADRMRNYQEAPDEFLKVHSRIREAFRIRTLQVEAVSQHIKEFNKPFIICGDFNDTPISYTYHRLQEGINDSFRYAGSGFGATFRYLWPALRIDYILFSNAFTATSHYTPKIPFSDHYPVLTELVIK